VTVRLRIPAALRQTTAGQATIEVRLSGANAGGADSADADVGGGAGEAAHPARDGPNDVRAVLDLLRASHPDLERRVRDEQGALRRHVNVFVGSTNIRDLDEQATVLADRDEIAILPAVSGG
jgi:molybdopterin converting factor small subunit